MRTYSPGASWIRAIVTSLVALICTFHLPAMAQGYTPKGPVEQKYMVAGPWAVSETITNEVCDRKGDLCNIYYPSQLGTNPLKGINRGFTHPVIVWANGTGMLPESYTFALRHFASWGFIVIAARDSGTDKGESTIDAANFIVAKGQDPHSPFFRKVDFTNMGISGHSQGAGTTVYLLSHQAHMFKTGLAYATPIVAISAPTGWVDLAALGQMADKSIFLFTGALDVVSDPVSNLLYYQSTSNSVDKVLGVVTLGRHDDVMNTPAFAHRGYPTAWFMWKLQGATDGRAAFVSGSGEFFRPSLTWTINQSNITAN